jgi:type IV secretory pathway component VirB8
MKKVQYDISILTSGDHYRIEETDRAMQKLHVRIQRVEEENERYRLVDFKTKMEKTAKRQNLTNMITRLFRFKHFDDPKTSRKEDKLFSCSKVISL